MVMNLTLVGDDLKCYIVKREEVKQKEAFGSGKWSDNDILAMSVISGCDYLAQPRGYGEKTVKSFMDKWVVADADERVKLLKSAETAASKGYAKQFQQTLDLFRHYPVFRGNVPDPDSCDDDDDGEVELEPLNPNDGLQRGKRGFNSAWAALIGWDAITQFEKTRVKKIDAFRLRWWARTSTIPAQVPKPTDGDGTEKPYGSILDFDECPACLVPTASLITWLGFRRIPLNKTSDRSLVVKKVEQVLKMSHDLPIRDDYTGAGARGSGGGGGLGAGGGSGSGDATAVIQPHSYDNWEEIYTADGEPMVWLAGDAVLTKLRTGTEVVDAAYFDRVNGLGRNGVRGRGLARAEAGHLDILNWRAATARLKPEPDGRRVTLITAKCTPSMKKETYSLLSVYDEVTGEFIKAPSRCGCPDGVFYCSHMMGLHLLIRAVQRQSSWSVEDFEAMLPEPIKVLQQLPIPVKYVYGDVAQEEKLVKAKQKELGAALAKDFPMYTAGVDSDEIDDVGSKERDLRRRSHPSRC